MRPRRDDPPAVEPPTLPGFELIVHERIDIMQLSIAGAMLIPLWAFGFITTSALLGGREHFHPAVTPLNVILAVVVATVVVPLLHEAAHGLAALVCHARPAFGVG